MPHFALRTACASWLLLLLPACGSPAKPSAKAAPNARTEKAAPAASQAAGPLRVDSAKVHGLYLDGEFDEAIALLEANLKETRQYQHDDSVFIFKHLGVMYAAQFDTREKGKYYMHRLLAVEPAAKIIDMYASDMIYMIFRNIQEEFEQNKLYRDMRNPGLAKNDTLSGPKAKKETAAAKPEVGAPHASGAKKWIWGGAAVATVAAGVGAYFLMNGEQPKVQSREYKF